MRDARNTTTTPMVTIPFRYPEREKRKLEAIQKLEDHESLSDTIRAACDAYIAAKLGKLAA